jgi:hypothetical protein
MRDSAKWEFGKLGFREVGLCKMGIRRSGVSCFSRTKTKSDSQLNQTKPIFVVIINFTIVIYKKNYYIYSLCATGGRLLHRCAPMQVCCTDGRLLHRCKSVALVCTGGRLLHRCKAVAPVQVCCTGGRLLHRCAPMQVCCTGVQLSTPNTSAVCYYSNFPS